MCISPITIPNPSYVGAFTSKLQSIGADYRRVTTNTKSPFIGVPCGHCSECVFFKQNSATQRVEMENLGHYLYFFTLTYNEDMIPRLHTSNGMEIKYADGYDLYRMFKRIRNNNLLDRPFKRFTVCERGSKRGRPHFHGIISIPKYPTDDVFTPLVYEKRLFRLVLDNWQRNVNYGKKHRVGGKLKKLPPKYVNLCDYIKIWKNGKWNTTYDLHYMRPSEKDGSVADVSFYVTKYLFKQGGSQEKFRSLLKMNLPEDEYLSVWSIVRNSAHFDNGFGLYDLSGTTKVTDKLIEKHIRKGIEFSYDKFPYPVWLNPHTGQSFPLANFYQVHFYTQFDFAKNYVTKLRDTPTLETSGDIDYGIATFDKAIIANLPDYEFKSGKTFLDEKYHIERAYKKYMKSLSRIEQLDFTINFNN